MPKYRRVVRAVAILFLLSESVAAQPLLSVSWPMLMDPEAQVYEDPYRELTQSQMRKLMALVEVQHQIVSGELGVTDMADHTRRAAVIEEEFASEGLDANWILSQREPVAERRQHAAVATNSQLEGKQVELSGYFFHAALRESGELVAYLLPDRGFCMHLPAPSPNQIVRLAVENLPDPLGPCIAAAVRGRLSVEESQHTVSSADGPTPIWNRWMLNVTEITTSGELPVHPSTEIR